MGVWNNNAWIQGTLPPGYGLLEVTFYAACAGNVVLSIDGVTKATSYGDTVVYQQKYSAGQILKIQEFSPGHDGGIGKNLKITLRNPCDKYVERECNASRDVICQECQVCAAGFYVNNTCGASYGNDRLDTQCALCPADSYCPGGSVSQAALECPATGTSAPGSDALADCLCDPGFYHSGLACVPCAPGTFSTGYETSLCAACAPGRFSAAVGATSGATCVECPAGAYATEPGTAACLQCPQSTWQNESVPADRARACTACPAHSSHGELGVTDGRAARSR